MPEIAEHANEQDKVQGWRLHVLIEAGYPLELAERVAASEADLHEDLHNAGRTPTTAQRPAAQPFPTPEPKPDPWPRPEPVAKPAPAPVPPDEPIAA